MNFSQIGDYSKSGSRVSVETKLSRLYGLVQQKEFKGLKNSHALSKTVLDDYKRIEFTGGTMQDLADRLNGKLDMAPFEQAYKDFEQGGLRKNISTQIQDCVPKRKRCFSEHDGEWSYDRRHEIEPFSRCKTKQSPARVLEIDAHFSISGWSKPADIDKYGAMVWGVSQLIEKCGIQTRIVWTDSANKFDEDKKLSYACRILLKEPGKYLAPSLLAACFSSLFYRRIGFMVQILGAEFAHAHSADGLGNPIPREAAEFKNSKLFLSPDAIHGSTQALETAILQAIKGN